MPLPVQPADQSQAVQTLLTIVPGDQLAPPLAVYWMRGLLAPAIQQCVASLQSRPRMKRFVLGMIELVHV